MHFVFDTRRNKIWYHVIDNHFPYDVGTVVKCAEVSNKYTNHVSKICFALNVFNSVNGSISIDHRVQDCHPPRRDILQYRQSTTLSPHAQECFFQ